MTFLIHGLAEILQVVGKALLLLADVELLDVVDEFLLQAVLVVIHIWNLLQSVNDVLSDLLHASLLVWFDASQERLDVIHFLSKFLLKSGSFLLAEGYEMVHSLANCIFCHFPLLIAQFFHIRLRCYIRKTQQSAVPVGWLRNACFSRNLLDLLVIILYKRRVDRSGICSSILINPDGEVNLASFQIFRDILTDFHLLLSIERSNTSREVKRLAI